jgi:hypothetical protein
MDCVAVATLFDVLAGTIDMAKSNGGGKMSFDIAAISGVGRGDVSWPPDPYGFRAEQELALKWVGDQAILSAPRWHSLGWRSRLDLTQAAIAIYDCIPGAAASHLTWLFSGKRVQRQDAAGFLKNWIEDAAPPVMDLIEFKVEDLPDGRSIKSFGLAAYVDHEIEAMIYSRSATELAKMVGHLSQETLRTGPTTKAAVIGPDGSKYSLKYIAETEKTSAVIEILEINN